MSSVMYFQVQSSADGIFAITDSGQGYNKCWFEIACPGGEDEGQCQWTEGPARLGCKAGHY